MPHYLIAGIPLDFEHEFDSYLDNNITAYQVDSHFDRDPYKMRICTKDSISPPNENPSYRYKRRDIYETETERTIVAYAPEGFVRQKIWHRRDFKSVEITLSTTLGDKLPEQEYTLAGLFFMGIALKENKLSLHASAIRYNHKAILFSGPSGTGKTTHTNHWLTLFDAVDIINDDKPLIYQNDQHFMAAGTPFSGQDSKNSNVEIPIGAIVFLRQGKTNKVYKPDKSEAAALMLRNVYRHEERDLMEKVMSLMDQVLKNVPVFILEATKDASSAKYLHTHLKKGGIL